MEKKGILSILVAVFLFGASSLFVKLIPVSAFMITLGRALFSSVLLYVFIHMKKHSLRLKYPRHYFWNLFAGLLLTCHWFFLTLSIQVSYIHIGTISFATYPIFVLMFEPYVFKEKYQFKNFISVILIVMGITYLVPAFEITNSTSLGILYGLISSFCYAILTLINRRLAASYDSVVISLYEQLVVTMVMTIVIVFFTPVIETGTFIDFIELVIYGFIFTALAHSLYIYGLTYVKAQTASIISVLEPVFSIFLAILIFDEKLLITDIIATVLILLAVILSSVNWKLPIERKKDA